MENFKILIESIIFGFMVFCTALTVGSYIQWKTTVRGPQHTPTTLEKRVVVKENNYV